MTTPLPDEVVRGFITAMNAWELDTYAAARAVRGTATPDSYTAPAKCALEAIFDRYCTARVRKYGRVNNMMYQHPPEYDPANERVRLVTEDRPRRRFVETERTAALGGGRYRYVVVLEDGRWRIDNLKLSEGAKWVQYTL